MKDIVKKDFLAFVRLGIGNGLWDEIRDVDWPELQQESIKQGLAAVVLDGIEELRKADGGSQSIVLPDKPVLTRWIGDVLQNYESRYDQYRMALSSLAGFYNSHGYKMMVLKGYACGITWPTPQHRPYGDIDIWLFGRQKEADAILIKEKNIPIDFSHHVHTVFTWKNFSVENHLDFVNRYQNKSNSRIEKVFKELGRDDTHNLVVNGETVYVPSPDFHALFLIRHAVNHFASMGITLRQVLDWAFFVKRYTKEIDWGWLNRMIDEYQMRDFVNCINAICVEELGFDSSIFNDVQFDPFLKERVLADIMNTSYEDVIPKHFFPRLYFKFMRWKENKWKREMCFKESSWSSFWCGLWSHVVKPSTI